MYGAKVTNLLIIPIISHYIRSTFFYLVKCRLAQATDKLVLRERLVVEVHVLVEVGRVLELHVAAGAEQPHLGGHWHNAGRRG